MLCLYLVCWGVPVLFPRSWSSGLNSLLESTNLISLPTSSSFLMGYGAEPRAPKVLSSVLTAFD